jgi:hypothetical protein
MDDLQGLSLCGSFSQEPPPPNPQPGLLLLQPRTSSGLHLGTSPTPSPLFLSSSILFHELQLYFGESDGVIEGYPK